MRYKMQTLLKIGLAGGICMSLIFFYAFHYSQNKQNVGQDQNPGSVQTDGDAEMFEKGAQHNEKIGKSGEQPEVTRNSDDPQPKVIKNSDDPQPKVIKNSDDPQPKVTGHSDDPQPKVTGNSDDPQPKVTGHSNDPQPKVTGHSNDPQPEITRNSDDPQPKVTGHSDDPQPKVTGNSDDPQPKVTGNSDDPQPKVIEHSDDPQPKVPKQSESKLDKKELKEKSNDEGHEKEKKHEEEKAAATSESIEDRMHLAVVACGDRLEETLVMMKSAIIMSEAKLHFHIFSDDNLQEDFKKQLNTWPAVKKKTASYSIYPITFPLGNEDQWRKLFKPCATQRLFLPSVLPKVDSLLYIDTDVLFMQPVDQIWSHFHHFNSSHISALAPEHEDSHVGWYNRFARHPYYPPLGVNSGVMLMNLTRMREAKWLDHIVPYYEEYRYRITWGDQDLINIFFHFFPEKLYVYPCEWNYRPDHCMYMSVCKTAEQYGVRIVHGNRGVYHNEKQLAFRAIYETLRDHPFEKSKQELSESIKRNMAAVKPSNCGKVGHIFTKALDEYIRDPKNKDKTLETKR